MCSQYSYPCSFGIKAGGAEEGVVDFWNRRREGFCDTQVLFNHHGDTEASREIAEGAFSLPLLLDVQQQQRAKNQTQNTSLGSIIFPRARSEIHKAGGVKEKLPRSQV